jgi:hypothetical protein
MCAAQWECFGIDRAQLKFLVDSKECCLHVFLRHD